MQYNQQSLPVSADQPLQHQFVQGNQLPTVPNIPETQYLTHEEAWQLHGELINLLQQSVSKGPIRIFLFNLYSQNRYVNSLYPELFGFAMEYYLYLKIIGQGDVRRAVDDTVKCDIPRLMHQYPALLGYLNQQQQSDLQQFVHLATTISQQMRQSSGGPQMGGQPQQNTQQGGPSMQFSSGGFSGNPPPGYRPGAGAWSQPSQPIQSSTRGPGMNSPNAGNMLSPGSNQAPPGMGGSRRPAVGAAPSSSLNTNPAAVPPAQQQGDTMRRPTEENRQLGHLMAVQEISHPAPPIDRNVEFVSSAYVPARRRNQRLIKTQVDGIAQYSVEDKQETDMDYNDHETNPDLIQLSRNQKTGPKVEALPEWEQVSMPTELSTQETTPEQTKELDETEAVYLKEPVMAYSLKQGRSAAMDQMTKLEVPTMNERIVEFYVDLVSPIGLAALAEPIQKLRETVDLTQMVDQFNELAEDMTPRVWYQLHDILTSVLNRRLRGGLCYQADVDSITDDYDALMDELAKHYSNTAVDRFKRHVHAAVLRTLNMREVNGKLLLSEAISVTEVPWTSFEIDLVLETKYAMLSKAVNTHMYAACLKLFRRTNTKDCNMSRRLLVTVDNVVIELHHGDMGQNTLLVSKASVCC